MSSVSLSTARSVPRVSTTYSSVGFSLRSSSPCQPMGPGLHLTPQSNCVILWVHGDKNGVAKGGFLGRELPRPPPRSLAQAAVLTDSAGAQGRSLPHGEPCTRPTAVLLPAHAWERVLVACVRRERAPVSALREQVPARVCAQRASEPPWPPLVSHRAHRSGPQFPEKFVSGSLGGSHIISRWGCACRKGPTETHCGRGRGTVGASVLPRTGMRDTQEMEGHVGVCQGPATPPAPAWGGPLLPAHPVPVPQPGLAPARCCRPCPLLPATHSCLSRPGSEHTLTGDQAVAGSAAGGDRCCRGLEPLPLRFVSGCSRPPDVTAPPSQRGRLPCRPRTRAGRPRKHPTAFPCLAPRLTWAPHPLGLGEWW